MNPREQKIEILIWGQVRGGIKFMAGGNKSKGCKSLVKPEPISNVTSRLFQRQRNYHWRWFWGARGKTSGLGKACMCRPCCGSPPSPDPDPIEENDKEGRFYSDHCQYRHTIFVVVDFWHVLPKFWAHKRICQHQGCAGHVIAIHSNQGWWGRKSGTTITMTQWLCWCGVNSLWALCFLPRSPKIMQFEGIPGSQKCPVKVFYLLSS